MEVFCRKKNPDSDRQEFCDEFSIEAGVHLQLCANDK